MSPDDIKQFAEIINTNSAQWWNYLIIFISAALIAYIPQLINEIRKDLNSKIVFTPH